MSYPLIYAQGMVTIILAWVYRNVAHRLSLAALSSSHKRKQAVRSFFQKLLDNSILLFGLLATVLLWNRLLSSMVKNPFYYLLDSPSKVFKMRRWFGESRLRWSLGALSVSGPWKIKFDVWVLNQLVPWSPYSS